MKHLSKSKSLSQRQGRSLLRLFTYILITDAPELKVGDLKRKKDELNAVTHATLKAVGFAKTSDDTRADAKHGGRAPFGTRCWLWENETPYDNHGLRS